MKQTVNILLSVIIIFTSSCRNRETPVTGSDPVRVKVTAISQQEISIPVHSTGILVSAEELKLSFKTGGIIAEINVREGKRVKRGELLASLNLSEISASVSQAENGYEKALRDFTRTENLYRDSVATLEQKQNAASALNVASSSLEIARFNLKHSTIIAPDNGLILKQFARTNELVSPGYPVFLFGESGKYWKVKTGLSDKDVVRINRGDSAILLFDAYPDTKFPAIVDQVGEMANPYTGTFETELIVKDSGYRLASGFIAGVDIYPSEKFVYTIIPVGSIVGADGNTGYIYALTDSGTVQKIKIDIEAIPGQAAAVEGIPLTIREIVSEGSAYLRDGMKVSVVR